jgi:hypothetical protein
LTRARSYLHRTKIHGWRINCELVVIGARPRQTQHRDLALDSEMSETCETNEMLPFLALMDCGAKMALKGKLSPLPRVKVKSSPLNRESCCSGGDLQQGEFGIARVSDRNHPELFVTDGDFPETQSGRCKDQRSIGRSRLAEGEVRCVRARN